MGFGWPIDTGVGVGCQYYQSRLYRRPKSHGGFRPRTLRSKGVNLNTPAAPTDPFALGTQESSREPNASSECFPPRPLDTSPTSSNFPTRPSLIKSSNNSNLLPEAAAERHDPGCLPALESASSVQRRPLPLDSLDTTGGTGEANRERILGSLATLVLS